jgi:hypothetical protein
MFVLLTFNNREDLKAHVVAFLCCLLYIGICFLCTVQISMFYDQDTSSIRNVFKFAATLQKFLADDPDNGDLAMQEYLHPVIATAALIWSEGPKANTKINVGNSRYGLTNVRFLQKYAGTKISMNDIHKKEWAVSTHF